VFLGYPPADRKRDHEGPWGYWGVQENGGKGMCFHGKGDSLSQVPMAKAKEGV